jgi:hypothetical protein
MQPNKSQAILGIIVGLLIIVILVLVLKPKPAGVPIDNNPAPISDGHENEKDNENSYPDTFTQDLKYGMDGNTEIQILQTYLIAEGYLEGTPNGSFYTATQAAVKKFQKAKGLSETGIVDVQTRLVLNSIFEDNFPVVSSACPGILVALPLAGSQVSFPLTIMGTIHPVGTVFSPNPWIVFEANAGSVVVKNAAGITISTAKPLTLSGEWMNTAPKPFSVTIPSISQVPSNPNLTLYFVDDNAAGDGEGMQHTCSVQVRL